MSSREPGDGPGREAPAAPPGRRYEMRPRPVGILCGMAMERAALGPAVLADDRFAVAVSGARPARAEAEAERLAAAGCRVLVSFGVAGGLDPALAPGTLLAPARVVTEAGEDWPLAWPEGLAAALGARPVERLLGLERVALGRHEKAALHVASGAAAVDMESHRVARAAARAGLAAIAIRAVADPAARSLPRLAADALDEEGRPRILTVLWRLFARPQDLPALLRTKRDTDAALASLPAAAPHLARHGL
ncbi:MAG: hypothetical protein AAF074_22730 [Pseudomonadota bacterium]